MVAPLTSVITSRNGVCGTLVHEFEVKGPVMRLGLWVSVLLLGVAPAVVAQDLTNVSLADVARQSREHAGTAKKSWDDQNSDFGRSPEDSGTACGAPLASVQPGYVSGLLGQPVRDPDMAKALLHWLDKHPDLDVMHPEDIARITFPMTPGQSRANQAAANSVAERWISLTSDIAEKGNQSDMNGEISSLMSTPYKSGADALLARAVREEQQRRVRSDGSDADKMQEAVNLYSICENRRQAQFETDIDKLAKAEFQKRLASGTIEVSQGK